MAMERGFVKQNRVQDIVCENSGYDPDEGVSSDQYTLIGLYSLILERIIL